MQFPLQQHFFSILSPLPFILSSALIDFHAKGADFVLLFSLLIHFQGEGFMILFFSFFTPFTPGLSGACPELYSVSPQL